MTSLFFFFFLLLLLPDLQPVSSYVEKGSENSNDCKTGRFCQENVHRGDTRAFSSEGCCKIPSREAAFCAERCADCESPHLNGKCDRTSGSERRGISAKPIVVALFVIAVAGVRFR